jgi:hypothetical protein
LEGAHKAHTLGRDDLSRHTFGIFGACYDNLYAQVSHHILAAGNNGRALMAGTAVLFVFANKLTTAANAIVLQYTAPIFVVIMSNNILKETPEAS